MDLKEFGSIFALMADYFDSRPSEAITQLYFESFKDWSFNDFKKACQSLMQNRAYNGLPKIIEIKEALYGKVEDRSALAFQSLMDTIKNVGPWESPVFEDGAVGHAIEAMGGWEKVNELTIEDWRFQRKNFESLYMANLRRGNIQPVKLLGAFDRINGANGYQGENKPVFIPSQTRDLLKIENKEVVNG